MPYQNSEVQRLQNFLTYGETTADDLVQIALEDGTLVHVRQTESDGMGACDWFIDPALLPPRLSKTYDIDTITIHFAQTNEQLELIIWFKKRYPGDNRRIDFTSASHVLSIVPVRRTSNLRPNNIDSR